MIVGIPKEVKKMNTALQFLPVGVEELVTRGHKVLVQSNAGIGSGLPDSDYLQAERRCANPRRTFSSVRI